MCICNELTPSTGWYAKSQREIWEQGIHYSVDTHFSILVFLNQYYRKKNNEIWDATSYSSLVHRSFGVTYCLFRQGRIKKPARSRRKEIFWLSFFLVTLRQWRWRSYVHPKRRRTSNELHSVTYQTILLFIANVARTSTPKLIQIIIPIHKVMMSLVLQLAAAGNSHRLSGHSVCVMWNVDISGNLAVCNFKS
jgi:hypothetical protein